MVYAYLYFEGNRLPPRSDTIADFCFGRMPVARDSDIHRALHLDRIAIARPRIMQLRNNAQIPLRVRPRSRPIIQVHIHILLVDPRPGGIRRRYPVLLLLLLLLCMARASRRGRRVRALVGAATVISGGDGEAERAEESLPESGSHDEFGEAGDAEDEEAAGHFGVGPEEKRAD